MSPKTPKTETEIPKKQPPSDTPPFDPALSTRAFRKDGLKSYIDSPQTFPTSRVVDYNDKYVLINDLYPKSSIHLLLLPRDTMKQNQHPFIAFADLPFLRDVQEQVKKYGKLAAKELKRRYGEFSVSDRAHEFAVEEFENGESAMGIRQKRDIMNGRDWSKEIIAGVHAHPSMNHLHIHILSRDRHSECIRHRKHYNSFATDFFVPMEAFPLAKDDPRRQPGREGYLAQDLVCWRCGKGFGNKFARLKEHLEEEFELWKRE